MYNLYYNVLIKGIKAISCERVKRAVYTTYCVFGPQAYRQHNHKEQSHTSLVFQTTFQNMKAFSVFHYSSIIKPYRMSAGTVAAYRQKNLDSKGIQRKEDISILSINKCEMQVFIKSAELLEHVNKKFNRLSLRNHENNRLII